MTAGGDVLAGRYQLLEPVGEGVMGRVWRARDEILGRVVAVQEIMLPPQPPVAHKAAVARTLREAQVAARLNHFGVVAIYDVMLHDGEPWIVMQFISGRSLRAEIAENGRLPWERAAEIVAQVADALAYAHAAGIVHRNLKPDNILLSESRAVVTGFGVASIIDGSKLTGTGGVTGTQSYAAPEELTGSVVGPAADMWALGAILYTAVEGSPPFGGPAAATAILIRPPVPPEHAGPLLELLEALLAKDPTERPDAKAVIRALASHHTKSSTPTGPKIRSKSYQNEELTLAIEQIRLRPPDDPWLIPVRLDECEIPYREIGAGRTITSFQHADLFGDRADESIERLVAAVLRILGRHSG